MDASTSTETGGDVTTPSDTGSSDTGGDGGESLTAFPSTSTMYQDISGAAVDSQWATISQELAGGWGNNFQLDPSFTVLYADPSVARRSFTQPMSALPDCDTAPVPIPQGGNVEGYPDYDCPNAGDDCHLLVFQGTRLYEMYHGSITGGQATGGTFTGSCLAVWDLTHDYWQPTTPFSRGDGCNGADAADLPLSPLLLKKAEIAAHLITHAMRFTINNPLIDNTYYVHPATHLGGSGTPMVTIPYGARLRLKSSFDVTTLATPEAQAIAVALQTYGMFLADGGNFFVSATTDITDVIDTHALAALVPANFDMVDGGTRYDFHQQTCTRTSISN
jgi:serine/threonine-protein kinase